MAFIEMTAWFAINLWKRLWHGHKLSPRKPPSYFIYSVFDKIDYHLYRPLPTMVQYYNEEQLISNVEEVAWEEDLSMVMDFDDEDVLSYTGHDSSMSLNVLGGSHPTYVNYNGIDKSTTKNIPGFCKHSDDSLKPSVVQREIPLVDMLGDIFAGRAIEAQAQQLESSNFASSSTVMTFDEQLEIAQEKLAESIRRSQITRPKFIQFSEHMMENEEFCRGLLSLKSKQCNGALSMTN